MGAVILGTLAVYAVIGAAIGLILRNNSITPYGIGRQYGRHYAKDLGLEEEKPVNSWKDQ